MCTCACVHVCPRGNEKEIKVICSITHHLMAWRQGLSQNWELRQGILFPLPTWLGYKPSFSTQGECRGFELRASGLHHKHSSSLSHLPSPSDPAHSRFSGKGRQSGGSGGSFGLWGSSNQLPSHSNFQQRETESQRANVHIKVNEKLSTCL